MRSYDHKAIEKKWQKKWDETGAFRATRKSEKPKYYPLIEFPYPSGAGLHVGHPRPYIALDIIARKRRAEGYNVLYPIGWDAFGLPTENYALKTGKDPRVVTKENTDTFRRQIQNLGISFDWSREINTTDPAYYKWTQWIFLQLYKKGLAYKAETAINWCPKDKIGLANEEVVDGKCERCGTPVEQRLKEQWMLAITKYAKRLYDDLDTVDYIERAKVQQRNWIGPSEGFEIDFAVAGHTEKITVFTTRPDTLYGATYMVLAPEHPLIEKLAAQIENNDDVVAYVTKSKKRTTTERLAEEKRKTGVEIRGVRAINPATEMEIPIWVGDYVLATYGTGAIMAVPAHDERDFAFATQFGLPTVLVISSRLMDHKNPHQTGSDVYTGEGILINSGDFTGMESEEAKKKIAKKVKGISKTTYRLRDWVFSRQRYWGEPIPMIHCESCGWQPVPEQELPVELPQVEKYQPTDTGESPLASIDAWVNVKCPKCKAPARRETDVMPNWAGSSWYYLRYCDPDNTKTFADPKKLSYWGPVDWYNGGMEHTVLHLLYSRFWHKFLYDEGLVPTSEPYAKRTSHGVILAEDGRKMSKSLGNVINPDDMVERVGADALRVYEMFMGPFDQAIAWSTDSLVGARRFLEKVADLGEKLSDTAKSSTLETLMHQSIKKVSEDIESLKMNTAVSTLMIFLNGMMAESAISHQAYQTFLKLLAPFAPHLCEELWSEMGEKASIQEEAWPLYDPQKIEAPTVTLAIQIDGKLRGTMTVPRGISQEEVERKALELPEISKRMEGKNPKKTIYVENRLINFLRDS